MYKSIVHLAVAAVLAIVACSAPKQAEQKQIAPVSSAPALRTSLLVSNDWLANNAGNSDLVVLHVASSPDIYDAGHIPSAQYLAWNRLAETVDGVANELPPVDSLTELIRSLGIDNSKRIVIYDEGNGVQAARAYFTLDYLGLGNNAALLDGQLAAWKDKGNPLSTARTEVARSSFVPEVKRRVLAAMEEVQRISGGGGSGRQLLDCRAPDEYSGSKPGRDISRGGHMPGAGNVPVTLAVQSAEMPLLKAPDDLRNIYRQAGFDGESQVVTYCRTGRSASMTYFVLKYLGYDVRLYDGSFSQWQADSANPVDAGE